MLYLVIINGLIDSFNPCAVGVLLLYLGLLLSMQSQKRHLISFGLFYILAIYTTYLFIGFGLLKTFHLFGIHDFFGWVASFIILGLGIYNLKEYFLPNLFIPVLSPFFAKCRIPKWNPNYTLISAIILGFLVGICEFPCSGGIYMATVALLSAKQTFMEGLSYLLIYNLMFILPLILIFALIGNKFVFEKLNKVQIKSVKLLKLIMGISMLISGILLLAWIIK
ncbi:MAG: cytochrome c biogenesis protein transmembrane region [uncultured bacterium]|nr:MAG: cytochrome c biogenesis protein transmembrane region [uncultured bacterium]